MRRAIFPFVILIGVMASAEEYARLDLFGTIQQQGQRLTLQADDGFTYDLILSTPALARVTLGCVGRQVRAQGRVRLRAEPGTPSRLLYWPDSITPVEVALGGKLPSRSIRPRRPADDLTDPRGTVPQVDAEDPLYWEPDVFELPFEGADPETEDDDDTILPQIDINW